MDRKLQGVTILNEAAATVGTYTSNPPVELEVIQNVGIQVNWSGGSGGPAGTISVECSNDNLTYTALTLSAVPTITGNSGSILINLNQVPFSWVRIVVTITAGTMALVAKLSAKEA